MFLSSGLISVQSSHRAGYRPSQQHRPECTRTDSSYPTGHPSRASTTSRGHQTRHTLPPSRTGTGRCSLPSTAAATAQPNFDADPRHTASLRSKTAWGVPVVVHRPPAVPRLVLVLPLRAGQDLSRSARVVAPLARPADAVERVRPGLRQYGPPLPQPGCAQRRDSRRTGRRPTTGRGPREQGSP